MGRPGPDGDTSTTRDAPRTSTRHWWVVTGASLLVYAIAVSPILRTPYVSDDMINSLAWGQAHVQSGGSFWAYTNMWIESWWTNTGRFFPLSYIHGYGIFWLVQSVTGYKVIQFTYAVVAALSFTALLRQLRVSASTAALAIIAMTTATQFGHVHDGLLSFGTLMPFLLTQIFLSLASFAAWLRTRRLLWLFLALVLYVAAALTYESAHLIGILFVAVALARGRRLRAALVDASPFLLVMAGGIALSVYGRYSVGGGGDYAVEPDAGGAVTVFVKQLFTSLPLTATGALDAARNVGVWAVACGLLAALVTAWATVTARDAAWTRSAWWLVAGGAAWCVLMAGPIALSKRYQAEITWHEGHVQTYAQYFGFGLLVAALATLLIRRVGRRAGAVLVALVAGAGTATAVQYNTQWTDAGAPERAARAAAERPLRNGLVDEVPTGGWILDTTIHSAWISLPAFYWQYGGRPLSVEAPIADSPEGFVDAQKRHPGPCTTDPAPGARWTRAFRFPDGVFMFSSTCINPSRDGYDTVLVEGLANPGTAALVGTYRVGLGLGRGFRYPVSALDPQPRGDALLLRVPRTGNVIDPGSLAFVPG